MRSASRTTVGVTKGKLRCAVYTRKSSEEGLEQDFNSLDAQREACETYVNSQKHAGWVVVETLYDDAGVSGATMERPALKRLLADIAARKVDSVVTYKIDRLTRALADFANIVEVFDAHGVSFVSVTQQFNTTTSMGRLTLNMLLSFAQFEREVMLIEGDQNRQGKPDPSLVKLIVKARKLKEHFIGGGDSLDDIAESAGVSRSYFTRLLKLAFLAPDITKSILEGRYPPDLTARRLINHPRLPLDWKDQRTAMGFT